MELLYSKTQSGFLLGSLLNDTNLLYNANYPLDKKDFEPFLAHRIIFVCITQLADKGVTNIDAKEIAEYLKAFPSQENALIDEFSNGDYIGYIETLKTLDNNKAYDFYYNEVRKRTLLREYRDDGFDISELFDENGNEDEQNAKLNNYSIRDILNYFDKKQTQKRIKYLVDDDGTVRKKAGQGGHAILDSYKESPQIGLGFESQYLTTLWGGFRRKQLYIVSGDTSSGKTRKTLSNLLKACVSEYYDTKQDQWVENLNGKHRGLYIGCEMTVDTEDNTNEVEPIMWAYLSGVDSSKITEGSLTEDEEERVRYAIDLLGRNDIWLTDMPRFDIYKLEEEIKNHKEMYDIEYVVFDYMSLNGDLIKEFVKSRGSGVATRGDEVLLELSKALKDLAKKYDVGIITATQVNADIKDFKNRDYQVIRGGKGVADKATGGSISMPITLQELKLVEPYIEKLKHNGNFGMREPNFVETVYKSRYSKFPKECKIFSYFDLGTMRMQELFVTDKNFMPIDVPKTVIDYTEDNEED